MSNSRTESSDRQINLESVNVVAGGSLGREIDLETVHKTIGGLDGVQTRFTDEQRWQLVIEFLDGGLVLLYRTGSYILRGGEDVEQLDAAKDRWAQTLVTAGVMTDTRNLEFRIQNIVFTGDLEIEVNLEMLMIQLGMERTEYEPEQFPGIIYRPAEFELVILIFSNGKIVLPGGTSEEEARAASEQLRNEIKEAMGQRTGAS